MNIPDQLKKEEFRFIPIQEGMKGPRLDDWQESNNFQYSDEPLQERINNGGNYGVVCGFGDLIVIDADTQEVVDAVNQNLPPTFTVRTGGGGFHFYYKCPNFDDPIRLKENKSGDVGDVQAAGKQVVGPGSVHPSGNKYKIEKDYEINKVKKEDIKFALKDWLKDLEESKEIRDKEKEFDINISDVLNLSSLKRQGDEYYGEHPIHGSTTGRNFWVNERESVWHCFRHNTGGGPLQWLAVEKGIIDCVDATSGVLEDAEKFREVLNALEMMGLWEPSDSEDKAQLPYFTDKGKFIPRALGEEIKEAKNYVTHLKSETIYVYEDGIYQNHGEQDIREEVQERLGSLSKQNYKNEVVGWIRDATHEPAEKFGGPKPLLPCENGIINLEEGELKDFDPNYIMLSKIPVKYDPEADCPKIKQFIREIVNDEDKSLIQEMFGYCLWKGYPLAKAFMLIGAGANGKSTLLNLLSQFLGEENVCSPSLQELLNNRFKKIELFGKLANLHADLGVEALEDTGTFKMLTGGDKILGEKKGKDPIEFYNHAKLMFSANEFPSTADRSDAFFRRWIVIEFPNQFLEGEEGTNPNIIENITSEEEMSGLLNWAIEGLHRILKKRHFSRTASREEVEGEWIRRTDSLRAFLDEWIDHAQGVKITKHLFYQLYKGYCNTHDIYTMKKGPVTKAVPSKEPRTEIYQPQIGDKQVRCWRDIDIKEEIIYEDFFKGVIEGALKNNTQDKRVKLYSSRASENKKILYIVRSELNLDYPVYDLKGEEDPDQEKLGKDKNTIITKILSFYKEHEDPTQTVEEFLDSLAVNLDCDREQLRPYVDALKECGDITLAPSNEG